MAERKNTSNVNEVEKPTKEEYAVAKFLRFNMPVKEAKLQNMNIKMAEVQCFIASAAIDALMESKWSASKNAQEPLFVNRSSCVTYCQRLLDKGLFHRAERVQRKKDKDKGERSKKKKVKDTPEKEEGGTGDELRERKKKEEKKEEEEGDVEKTPTHEGEEVTQEKTEEEKKEEKKDKKEKQMKLVMVEDQTFEDGDQNIYVWIYDPPNAKTLVIGGLIVFGAAALCLFPLWPYFVRVGVYYTSLVASGFVGFILSLVVLRFILFCAIWLVTLGRHHFWLLPNLTEDVSVMESFRPLYKHKEVLPGSAASGKTYTKSRSEKKAKGKSKKKDKASDPEDSGSDPEFEMIHRGDVEDDEDEERMEGEEEDSEENGDAREDEEYGAEEEEEDYEEDEEEQNEEGQNDGLEEGYEDQEEEEGEEEESDLKKDK